MLCLPASDQADEVAATMFARLLQLSGIEAHDDSIDAVRTGTMDLVDRVKPDVVVVCALPPGAVMPARYLCKRVRSGFGDLPILVGLWNALGDTDKARQRLESAGAGKVVTTFAGGIDVIRQLAHSVDQAMPREAVEAYAGV